MTKFKELKTKSADELSGMEQELRKEALNLRFQQASGQLKNTARRRQVRRDIAKIKTLLAGSAKAEKPAKAAKKASKKSA